MKILVAHNYYQQPGGEDQVFAAETELLRSRGHDVETYVIHNDRVDEMSRLGLAAATLWNRESHREITQISSSFLPDVVHFHNTLPLISPAGYHAARACGAAVVQTLHNYRLICPGSLLMREGTICEKCIELAMKWPAVVHACYRESAPASAAVAGMLAMHESAGTWSDVVDAYIALTGFAREKFVAGGLPVDRVHTKPNFTSTDPGTGAGKGGYALFVGRLSHEKGIQVLLEAWSRADIVMPLKVAGDGPMASAVSGAGGNVTWLGRISQAEVYEQMKNASLLVFPSTWYEGMPLTIIEALACGTPVAASNLGAMSEMIRHGNNGLHFRAGDAADLARAVNWAANHPEDLTLMRQRARTDYDRKYSASENYDRLLSVYGAAIDRRHASKNAA